MRKLSPREFGEFSQDHTSKKWKMRISLAAKPVQFPVSHHLTKRSEILFSRNLREGERATEPECREDAASGLVSSAGPACRLESKNIKLWGFCWWGLFFFLFMTAFAHSQSLGISLVPFCLSDKWAGSLYHTLGLRHLAGSDSARIFSHDFVFVLGLSSHGFSLLPWPVNLLKCRMYVCVLEYVIE